MEGHVGKPKNCHIHYGAAILHKLTVEVVKKSAIFHKLTVVVEKNSPLQFAMAPPILIFDNTDET
jgi:hypothetical protein